MRSRPDVLGRKEGLCGGRCGDDDVRSSNRLPQARICGLVVGWEHGDGDFDCRECLLDEVTQLVDSGVERTVEDGARSDGRICSEEERQVSLDLRPSSERYDAPWE